MAKTQIKELEAWLLIDAQIQRYKDALKEISEHDTYCAGNASHMKRLAKGALNPDEEH